MKTYPIDKYKFYQQGTTIYAVTTYAGQTVKGTARLAEGDTFNFEKGKTLAAARCAAKVAKRRLARARIKLAEAKTQVAVAKAHRDKMRQYKADAKMAVKASETALRVILKDM